MPPTNLNDCDPICTECVKHYIKKHNLKKGDAFKIIGCKGIPKNPISSEALATIGVDPETAKSMMNPVLWAARFLDWHCEDPDGSIWKRKTQEGSLNGMDEYDEILARQGKSIFNRPYQKCMLACSSQRKVFRIGRQCLAENSMILLSCGDKKSIKDIKSGDSVVSFNTEFNCLEKDIVTDSWYVGKKETFTIKTSRGNEITCTDDHPFLDHKRQWLSIRDGLSIGDHLYLSGMIISIQRTGIQDVYDIEVEKNHNFVANGIVSHNCGKSAALRIAILYYIFTNKNFHVEIVAPYQSQIEMNFKGLNELINSNPILKNSVCRTVKAPQHVIELKNGSQVIGFSSGANSKQEAGSARGQSCQLLLLDEGDYLNPQDITSVMASVLNFRNASVWVSSTPTGKRETFFNLCHDPYFKEFHYESSDNPSWSENHEATFRSTMTESEYDREIRALFGEKEEGVYQQKYIELAKDGYEYGQLRPDFKWTYMIGCDWNGEKVGTTIAVLGKNPQNGIIYLVDKHIISKANRTQLTSCEKIRDLNGIWHPDYIYVDQGFGHGAIEYMHDLAMKALPVEGPEGPTARLTKVLKGYEFGGSIKIKDPFTKQDVKKPSKAFLVDNSVKRFEEHMFKYPASDEDFTKQLEGYVIDRVSYDGRPTYKAQNERVGDHFLDAVNLALVAFTLEKSQFGKVTYSPHIAFSGHFGESPSASPSYGVNRRESKPSADRTGLIEKNDSIIMNNNNTLPAAHTSNSIRTWNWTNNRRQKPFKRPSRPSRRKF